MSANTFVPRWGAGLLVALAMALSTTAKARERIVSLDGISTEILFALGVGDSVVGRDASSYYPPQVEELPEVGYQFQLNAEGILSLKPTLVIGRDDVKPPQVPDQLRAAGVKVVAVPTDPSVQGARDKITTIARAVDREQEGKALLAALDKDLAQLQKKKKAHQGKGPGPVLALYFRGTQTAFVLGENTNPVGMLKLVGSASALPRIKETQPITPEALVAAQPEVFLVFRHSLESIGGVDALLKMPGVAQTPAGKNRRVVAMDDLLLGGFGPRTGKAALQLFEGLYEKTGTVILDPP